MQSENAEFDGVPVRIYVPPSRKPNGPAILYLHGGGWYLGDIGMGLVLLGYS